MKTRIITDKEYKAINSLELNTLDKEQMITLNSLIIRLEKEAGYTKHCEWCNRLYKPHRITQKYCSVKCQQAVGNRTEKRKQYKKEFYHKHYSKKARELNKKIATR